MKLKSLAAAIALVASAPAFSEVFDLGTLDTALPLYHSFADFQGAFTDIYTFTLADSSNHTLVGDTTTINAGNWWNVALSSVSLSGTGIASTLVDANPNDGFSFQSLSGQGSYSLTVKGTVSGTGMNGVNGIYAGYVSAVPEPHTIGLALMGLLATGVALRRRA
jgi:PEP-CTERM motif-containing protein